VPRNIRRRCSDLQDQPPCRDDGGGTTWVRRSRPPKLHSRRFYPYDRGMNILGNIKVPIQWISAGFVALWAACALSGTVVHLRVYGYGPVGRLEVELFDDKPATVANFLRLTESGSYSNMFFHRLVPGFVIQGGGFRVAPDLSGVELVPHFGTVTNEFSTGTIRSNVRGTLAMAKVPGDPDSATCQFFINLADNSAILDGQNGGFTVFGRIIADPDGLLDFWNSLFKGYGIVDLGEPFSDLPVNYAGTNVPSLGNLIYCDVFPLRVSIVSPTPAARVVQWTSAAGLTNVLEVSTQLTSTAWSPLATISGTGDTATVTDTNSAPVRFYRVRVQP